jgi:hypothetical protein
MYELSDDGQELTAKSCNNEDCINNSNFILIVTTETSVIMSVYNMTVKYNITNTILLFFYIYTQLFLLFSPYIGQGLHFGGRVMYVVHNIVNNVWIKKKFT